ncbi:MAG TPA: hypothetical protein VGI46_11805 [Candidatus Acidoferrum sp.]
MTRDQEVFIRQAIASGRFHDPADAVQEALSMWESRERRRLEFLASLDEAEASLARGEGRLITRKSMRDLADQVKRREQARLAEK